MEKTWIPYSLALLLIVGILLFVVYRQMERRNRRIHIKNPEASKHQDIATFRVRFRFRVQKYLNIKEHEYRFNIGQRELVISPQLSDNPINQSEWLVINARGFNRSIRELTCRLLAWGSLLKIIFASKTVY
jgi:hypothetical protein